MKACFTHLVKIHSVVHEICERSSMVCAPVRKENARALAWGLPTVQAHKPCSLTCTIISSVELAHYRVSCAKDWVSVNCGTMSVSHVLLFSVIVYGGHFGWSICKRSKWLHERAVLTQYWSKFIHGFLKIVIFMLFSLF